MRPGFVSVFNKKPVRLSLISILVFCLLVVSFIKKHDYDVKNKQKKEALAAQQRYKESVNQSAKAYLRAASTDKDFITRQSDIVYAAQAYEKIGEWQKAIDTLKRAIAIDDGKTYYYFAEIAGDYKQLGDTKQANTYYDLAVESAKRAGPSVVDATKYAGYINTQKNPQAASVSTKKQGIPD
jgi:tetratricopeptide (TPR) repeat protein